tara:strand:+ start:107 stop:727 length:621 start_codon:yes stop_codon:yes gene_type:complete
MANPRTGMYDPLNPLGLHSENRYRSPVYSMGAETESFEALGTLLKGGAKGVGKGFKGIGKGFGKGFKFSKKGFTKLKNARAQRIADKAATGGTKGAKNALGETFEALGKTPPSFVLATGGAIAVILVGINAGDALESFTDNFTGANCADNVKDRGLTEGSEEYNEAVKECQEGKATNLTILAVGVIGVIGLVGFLTIKKVLPAKED